LAVAQGTHIFVILLYINVCALIRLRKEIASYEKEASQQEARIAKMRSENQDGADIRKQVSDFAKFSCLLFANRIIKGRSSGRI